MQRRLFRRLGALCALWSLVVTGGPVTVHPCPEHNGTSVALAAAGADQSMSDSTDATMDASMHSHGTSPTPSHAGHCQCPRSCCASSTTPLAQPPVLIAVAESAGARQLPAHGTARLAFPAPDHTLPFANGPPAV